MLGFDTYSLQARLLPTLLVVLPVGISVVAWFPEKFVGWGVLVSVATTCGLTLLLAQLGRDLGKKKESALFQLWGGKPTTQILRHSDENLDENTKARYHAKLGALIPGIEMPSRRKESANHSAADAVYDSCIRFLLEATRDRKRYPLVFAENVNYGFRRNLWGMKPAGLFLSFCGVAAAAAAVAWAFYCNGQVSPAAATATALNAVLLVLWLVRVTRSWVRTAAFAYATRLLAACENLTPT